MQAAGSGEAEGELEAALISDLSNEDDWGLDGLTSGPTGYVSGSISSGSGSSQRRSLLQELEAEEAAQDMFAEGSLASLNSLSVQWGGSAGATGLDLEEQEEMLRRYFKPSQVKKLLKEQVEVDAAYSEFRVSGSRQYCSGAFGWRFGGGRVVVGAPIWVGVLVGAGRQQD